MGRFHERVTQPVFTLRLFVTHLKVINAQALCQRHRLIFQCPLHLGLCPYQWQLLMQEKELLPR